MNNMFEIFMSLVKNINAFNRYLVRVENGMDAVESLELSTMFVCQQLKEGATRYKRKQHIQSKDTYVAPEELTLGVRWETAKKNVAAAMVHTLVPCKFQYISIIKTIISLFQRDDFRNAYFTHNNVLNESESSNAYSSFRSGNVFKSNPLYKKHPNSLQIEIATDDFEICNQSGSKATLHKLTPIYLSIKNVPPQFASKTDAIYPCSLCYSDDLKTKYTDFNDIWHHVVSELSDIENGIDIGNGEVIHGTLAYFNSDNLGSNAALSLVQNFSRAYYFCRFCLCSKDEIRSVYEEIPQKIRTKEGYNDLIEIVNNSTSVDLTETKGVVRYCLLNELKYFHMIDNMVPDIMHDLDEGAIPILLHKLFSYCIKMKVCTEKYLASKFQYHDYGFSNKKNEPSKINLEKDNLNQNASQLRCLFRHTPFILYDLRDNEHLKSIWHCVSSLLRVVQIAYSTNIDEEDINYLQNAIKVHLRSFKRIFETPLRFKQHVLTHYPTRIREMGPLKPMSMIRMESKHQDLKGRVGGKNFVNLCKTICENHQEHMSRIENVYSDNLSISKQTIVSDSFLEQHPFVLGKYLDSSESTYKVKFFEWNGIIYREKMFVHINRFMYEIHKILLNRSEIYLFCLRFDYHSYNDFLHSIQITPSQPVIFELIPFKSLNNKHVYEKLEVIDSDKKYFIILENLDLKPMYNLM